MLQNEFEKLTGLKVNQKEYRYAEVIYNDLKDMDKFQFCADWKKHKDSKIIEALAKENASVKVLLGLEKEKVEMLTKERDEAREKAEEAKRSVNHYIAEYLAEMADKTCNAEFARAAIALVGMAEFVDIKVRHQYRMYEKDLSFLFSQMKPEEQTELTARAMAAQNTSLADCPTDEDQD